MTGNPGMQPPAGVWCWPTWAAGPAWPLFWAVRASVPAWGSRPIRACVAFRRQARTCMRDLLVLEATDARAAEAVALFCYQAKKCVGAYAA